MTVSWLWLLVLGVSLATILVGAVAVAIVVLGADQDIEPPRRSDINQRIGRLE